MDLHEQMLTSQSPSERLAAEITRDVAIRWMEILKEGMTPRTDPDFLAAFMAASEGVVTIMLIMVASNYLKPDAADAFLRFFIANLTTRFTRTMAELQREGLGPVGAQPDQM